MFIGDGIEFAPDGVLSFLLVGQSNMAGRGTLGEVPEIVNDKCYMLRMGRWQAMREPVNPDRPIFQGEFRSGVGLSPSFADALQKKLGCGIGLIPCADGGTKISQWQPGEVLYDHAVFMARLAMRTSTLGGILWHQGESDCHDENDMQCYTERLYNTLSSFRKDLGRPELPIVLGEISENITERWNVHGNTPRMNGFIRETAAKLGHSAVASARDLTLKPDGIHFCSASLRTLGVRYYEEYCHITNT